VVPSVFALCVVHLTTDATISSESQPVRKGRAATRGAGLADPAGRGTCVNATLASGLRPHEHKRAELARAATPQQSEAEAAGGQECQRCRLRRGLYEPDEHRIAIGPAVAGAGTQVERRDGGARRAADHDGLVLARRRDASGAGIKDRFASRAVIDLKTVGQVEVRGGGRPAADRQRRGRGRRAVEPEHDMRNRYGRTEGNGQRLRAAER
jgi:hypothetical protein